MKPETIAKLSDAEYMEYLDRKAAKKARQKARTALKRAQEAAQKISLPASAPTRKKKKAAPAQQDNTPPQSVPGCKDGQCLPGVMAIWNVEGNT